MCCLFSTVLHGFFSNQRFWRLEKNTSITIRLFTGKPLHFCFGYRRHWNNTWFCHTKQRNRSAEDWERQNRLRVYRCLIPETDPCRRRGKDNGQGEHEWLRRSQNQGKRTNKDQWRKQALVGYFCYRFCGEICWYKSSACEFSWAGGNFHEGPDSHCAEGKISF